MDKTRTCRICKKEKPIDAFYIRENGKHRTECIECQKQRVKRWYQNTRPIRIKQREEYRTAHRQELLKKQKDYYYKNREQVLQKHYARRKQAKKDSTHKEIEKIRWTLQGIMHNDWGYTQPKSKKRKIELEKILGCSIEEFKDYMLKTWKDKYGTAWDNEPFHIDHILPLSSAKTPEDVIKLCHYSNLRMLTPDDNLTRPKLKYRESL